MRKDLLARVKALEAGADLDPVLWRLILEVGSGGPKFNPSPEHTGPNYHTDPEGRDAEYRTFIEVEASRCLVEIRSRYREPLPDTRGRLDVRGAIETLIALRGTA